MIREILQAAREHSARNKAIKTYVREASKKIAEEMRAEAVRRQFEKGEFSLEAVRDIVVGAQAGVECHVTLANGTRLLFKREDALDTYQRFEND